MKNTIVVLIMLLLSSPICAQQDNRNSTVPYQKYASLHTEASAAFHLLGIASSIAAGVFFPSHTRPDNLYLNGSRAIEDAYLKSTYRKEN
jgi:hypothetical protein